MRKTLLLIWVFLRLPIILAGFYLFRTELLVWIERYFNLALIIEASIYLISTAWIRLLLVGFTAIAIICIYLLIKKFIPTSNLGYFLFIFISFIFLELFLKFLLKANLPFLWSSVVFIILIINILPEIWLSKYIAKNSGIKTFFLIIPAISEFLFLQSYLYWVSDFLKPNSIIKRISWLAGILLVCFYSLFFITPYNNQRVLTLGEKLHANSRVEKISEGGYNWIEFNSENHLLYATGHNVNYIFSYDTENLNLPPQKSNVQVGKPQSFTYNPDLQEIYVYKRETEELLYLDAITLELFRSVSVPNLAPGDVWVNWQSGTDTITIASEADYKTGVHFIMLDRESGEILEATDFPVPPTNVAFDIENGIFYFSSFRENYLFSWDMINKKILNHVEISKNTDRLIYKPVSSEVLAASPQEGTILRYDATTLEFKGKINTSIGDRTLTLDEKRNLLLVGNFINNNLQVIDLNTHNSVGHYYIGPWIRTIALDTEKGVAYVSTVHNLFKVTYAE